MDNDMTQVIIYKNDIGNVSVTIPTGELPITEVLAKDCPAGAIIVDSSTLPEEYNEFFNAWVLNDKKISVDFLKAQEITKNRLREERTPLLQALDVAQLRNLADPVVLADIEAKKQVLRDATQQVDSLTTLDELKAAQLPVL
jgi:hypothetical protein